MMNILNKEVEIAVFNINGKAGISMEKQEKIMNLDEALHYLDGLQVSERAEDESDIDISHQSCAKIYIQPLVYPFGDNSDLILVLKKNPP